MAHENLSPPSPHTITHPLTQLRPRGLLAGRTVVLATNQLQYVRQADVALYLAGGKVAEAGPPEQLMAAGGAFAALMAEVAKVGRPEGYEGPDVSHPPLRAAAAGGCVSKRMIWVTTATHIRLLVNCSSTVTTRRMRMRTALPRM